MIVKSEYWVGKSCRMRNYYFRNCSLIAVEVSSGFKSISESHGFVSTMRRKYGGCGDTQARWFEWSVELLIFFANVESKSGRVGTAYVGEAELQGRARADFGRRPALGVTLWSFEYWVGGLFRLRLFWRSALQVSNYTFSDVFDVFPTLRTMSADCATNLR